MDISGDVCHTVKVWAEFRRTFGYRDLSESCCFQPSFHPISTRLNSSGLAQERHQIVQRHVQRTVLSLSTDCQRKTTYPKHISFDIYIYRSGTMCAVSYCAFLKNLTLTLLTHFFCLTHYLKVHCQHCTEEIPCWHVHRINCLDRIKTAWEHDFGHTVSVDQWDSILTSLHKSSSPHVRG